MENNPEVREKKNGEQIERALAWLESNEQHLKGVSVWDEMNSSRPNIDTVYVAWAGDFGEDSALVVTYHNGLGEDAGVDSAEVVSAEKAKEIVSHCSDPLPTTNSVDWLKQTLEKELE